MFIIFFLFLLSVLTKILLLFIIIKLILFLGFFFSSVFSLIPCPCVPDDPAGAGQPVFSEAARDGRLVQSSAVAIHEGDLETSFLFAASPPLPDFIRPFLDWKSFSL